MFNIESLFSRKNIQITKPTPKQKPILTDVKDLSNQGIILINDSDMQSVLKNSGKHAESNEYQVHYWSLIFRHVAADNSILDICIPTVYFNYAQQVSHSRIDFHLTDVDDMSETVLPVHNMKVAEIMKSSFKQDIEERFGITLEPLSVNLSSIHCHPGSSTNQGFSGTDLSKNIDDLGVVYPLADATDNKPNFAGIMVRKTKNNNVVAHYEYRVANGKLNYDNDETPDKEANTNLKYKEGRCAALISKKSSSQSFMASMFGAKTQVNNYEAMKNCSLNNQFEFVREAFDKINFNAFTDTILPDNVTLKQSIPNNYYNQSHFELSNNNRTQFEFDTPLLDSTSKRESDPFKKYEVGISPFQYECAMETIAKYDGINILDSRDIENLSLQAAKEYHNTLHILWYDQEADDTYYKDILSEEDLQMELIFEAISMADDIKNELEEAIEVINIYEEENSDQFDREVVLDQLVKSGFSRSAMILKSDEELSLFHKCIV